MTQIRIPTGETDVTRVFHIDLPADSVKRFADEAGTGEWPLKSSLGATELRADMTEIVKLRDLGTMPLSTYLAEAYDLEGPDFARDRARLDTLSGHVLVLPSRALGATAQTLNVQSPLTHIGSYGEPKRSAPAAPLRSTSAEGSTSGPAGAPVSTRSPLLRVLAGLVLVLIAGAVLYLVLGASS